MNSKLFIFVIFLSTSAFAESSEKMYFTIDNKVITFIVDKTNRYTVDNKCYKNKGTCEAVKKLSRATYKGLSEKFKGGASRGAVICKNKLAGTLVLAHDQKGNQTVFCRFKDGSYIANGSIKYHAVKNDDKRKRAKISLKI